MSTCVEKLPCHDCDSTDSRQVFYNEQEDRFTSFCFASCYSHKGDPYKNGDKPKVEVKSPEQIKEEVREVSKCVAFKGLGGGKPYRGIPAKFFDGWSVRLLLSERDGITPFALGFAYSNMGKLAGWKIVPIDFKAFWSVGSTKDADPFGLERALKIGGKKLYITEGEFDAIALNYALVTANAKSKWSQKAYPVISLSAGGGSMAKNLNKILKRIKHTFKEVVLVVDNDEVGLAAEKVAQTLLPDVLRADKPMGCKDANDAIKTSDNLYKLAKMAQWDAHKPPIEGIVRVRDVIEKALEKVEYGLSYPFPSLTELTLGQKFGETCCLGAGIGTGKTVIAHKFAAHNMSVHGEPCFAILLEENNARTLRNICSKIDSVPYGNPNAIYDVDQYRTTANSLDDKLIMWESNGDQGLRFDIESILSAIRFNFYEYGTRFAYMDNFTRLVDHLSTSDANEFINKYSSEIENLSAQLGMHIMGFSHLNAPPKYMPSHEEGGEVYANQFTGSKGIIRSFPMLMGFQRNKHAKDEGMDKNNSILSTIKHRNHDDGEGSIRLTYYPETGQIQENEWEGEIINEDKRSTRR